MLFCKLVGVISWMLNDGNSNVVSLVLLNDLLLKSRGIKDLGSIVGQS